MDWSKASESQNKSAGKKGGGKLTTVMTDGGKGIPAGTSAPNSSVGRVKGNIATPTTDGNKGIVAKPGGGFSSKKAPLSE